jgi:hypothetical protein
MQIQNHFGVEIRGAKLGIYEKVYSYRVLLKLLKIPTEDTELPKDFLGSF